MEKNETMNDEQLQDLLEYLKMQYQLKFDKLPDNFNTDIFILSQMRELLTSVSEDDLKTIIDDDILINRIKMYMSRDWSYLYEHPVMFVICYLMKNKKYKLIKEFPFPPDDLVPFYVLYGISQRD